jgi:ribose 5-phosphate isomerase B
MAANKVKGVRCALCWNNQTAELSRKHNNSNVLSIGQRMTSIEIALDIVDIWLKTEFEGGRHQHRIDEMSVYEETGELVKLPRG